MVKVSKIASGYRVEVQGEIVEGNARYIETFLDSLVEMCVISPAKRNAIVRTLK